MRDDADDITIEDIKSDFSGSQLGDELAELHVSEENAEAEVPDDSTKKSDIESADIVNDVVSDKAGDAEAEEGKPVDDLADSGKVAALLDKITERMAGMKSSEKTDTGSVTDVEVKKSFLEEMGAELPDFSSDEVKGILENDSLSPEVRELFEKQQSGFSTVLEKVYEKLEANTRQAETTRAILANRRFWDQLGTENSDYQDFVKPEGEYGADAVLGEKAEEWLSKQPAFIAVSAKEALLKGDASQVKDVIEAIKNSDPAIVGSKKDISSIVDGKVTKANEVTHQPKSLSGLPGTVVPPKASDEVENSDDKVAAARRFHGGNLAKYEELLGEVFES